MINSDYRFILASNSPRRSELLTGLGLSFETRILPAIDESWPDSLCGQEIPIYISKIKADKYKECMARDEFVITADTIVYMDNRVFGKPNDYTQAFSMLHALSGRWHEVITGVTFTTIDRQKSFSVTTRVKFSELTDNEISYYLKNYAPYDKAGAYGIQEWIGYIGVEKIEGSYFNVVGLPVQHLYREMNLFFNDKGV